MLATTEMINVVRGEDRPSFSYIHTYALLRFETLAHLEEGTVLVVVIPLHFQLFLLLLAVVEVAVEEHFSHRAILHQRRHRELVYLHARRY